MKEKPSKSCKRTGIGRGQHLEVQGAGLERFTLVEASCQVPATSWLLTINLASPTSTSPSTSRPRLEVGSSSQPWTACPTSRSRWSSGRTTPESRLMTPPSVRWLTTTLPSPSSRSLNRAELTTIVFFSLVLGLSSTWENVVWRKLISSWWPNCSLARRRAKSKKRTAPPLLVLRSTSTALRRRLRLSCAGSLSDCRNVKRVFLVALHALCTYKKIGEFHARRDWAGQAP